MELEKKELEFLKKKKEFCTKAKSVYNKKLPKKLLMAFGIGLLYSLVRVKINPEEKISFFTTLVLIVSFLTGTILIEHFWRLNKIKKDIKEVDAMIYDSDKI